ncbi:hypothetical protein ACFSTC_62510 [Nonomuraea ferruginea]
MSEQPGHEVERDIREAAETSPRPAGATPGIEDSIGEHELRRAHRAQPGRLRVTAERAAFTGRPRTALNRRPGVRLGNRPTGSCHAACEDGRSRVPPGVKAA